MSELFKRLQLLRKHKVSQLALLLILFFGQQNIAHAFIAEAIKSVVSGFFAQTEKTLQSWGLQIKQTAASTVRINQNQQNSMKALTQSFGATQQHQRLYETTQNFHPNFGQSSLMFCTSQKDRNALGFYDYNQGAFAQQQMRSISNPIPQSQSEVITQSLKQLAATKNKPMADDTKFFHQSNQGMAEYIKYDIPIAQAADCNTVSCMHQNLQKQHKSALLNLSQTSWITH